MTKDFAAHIAMLSMLSVFLPLIVGLLSSKQFNNFYKCVLASITMSLVFDAFSFLSNVLNWISASILSYYGFFAILCWGLTFTYLQKENKLKGIIPNILILLILLLALYIAATNLRVFSLNDPNTTLSSLFILASSTIFVMYFLIVKREIEKSDIPIIVILSANIVYHATASSIYTFFESISSEQQMGMLYLIKWTLYILLNVVFAFTFYMIRRGKWSVRRLSL